MYKFYVEKIDISNKKEDSGLYECRIAKTFDCFMKVARYSEPET